MKNSKQRSGGFADDAIFHPAMGVGFSAGHLGGRNGAAGTRNRMADQPKPYRNPWADRDGYYVFQSA